MDVLVFLLFGVANIALLIGLMRPRFVGLRSRVAVAWLLGGLSFGLLILFGVVAEVPPTEVAETRSSAVEEVLERMPSDEAGVNVESGAKEAFAEGAVASTEEEVAGKVEASGRPAVAAAPTEEETVTPAPAPVAPEGNLFNVVGVVDGDTIKVSMGGTVETLRLIGMDTPETKDPRKPVQCFGEEASKKAKELLSGRKVRLEADASQDERDKYGRLLRYVRRDDGLFFNDWMIRNGYAHEYTYNAPYKYQAAFKDAQRYASDNDLGLWSPSTCDGETVAVVETAAPAVEAVPMPVADVPSEGHTFYTSSYSSAKYYYCDTDAGWKSLTVSNLKSFPSERALLAAYPKRTLHAPCE